MQKYNSKVRIFLAFLSIFFVLFSFSPSLYEIVNIHKLQNNRTFVLEHNYMFDYNFYLSRIREGQEGRWLVEEKYYDEPHGGSFFQILYLYMGKFGGLFSLNPPIIYHLLRIIFGFIFLLLIGSYMRFLFEGKWSVFSFLLIVTASSFPILMWINGIPRFGTYMGWWSAIDSLQRITFLPHILVGQIGLLIFVRQFSERQKISVPGLFLLGVLGFVVGLIFPPILLVLYVFFVVIDVLYISIYVWEKYRRKTNKVFKAFAIEAIRVWLIPQIIFFIFSFPVFVYLYLMFQVMPWKALALFDIEHPTHFDLREYLMALGPVFPFGVLGMILAFIKKDIKFYALVAWVISIFILFRVFVNVPEQSPSRFTEAALHIPLGALCAYFFHRIICYLRDLRILSKTMKSILQIGLVGFMVFIILTGLGVMVSMIGWLTDQAYAKRTGTFRVPIGAQLAYPLKDFMDGVYFLRDNTQKNSIVLTYVTAGNFIPAYAGNFVYLGHANTPDETWKEIEAARFFKGEMTVDKALMFLETHHINYIYFGPQEKELGGVADLLQLYPTLLKIYENNTVIIYSVQ